MNNYNKLTGIPFTMFFFLITSYGTYTLNSKIYCIDFYFYFFGMATHKKF